MNLEKTVNIIAIVLLLGLACVALVVMQKTTESNAVTTSAALHQSKKRSRVAKEVRMLTLEMKNLQKDLEEIRKTVERQEKQQRKRK